MKFIASPSFLVRETFFPSFVEGGGVVLGHF